eukprot:scaffold108044_cov33-Prasinocladus_malaysianus.AAC.1
MSTMKSFESWRPLRHLSVPKYLAQSHKLKADAMPRTPYGDNLLGKKMMVLISANGNIQQQRRSARPLNNLLPCVLAVVTTPLRALCKDRRTSRLQDVIHIATILECGLD